MSKEKAQAVSLALGGFLAIMLIVIGNFEWDWLGFVYTAFAMIVGFIQWIEIDKRNKNE